MERTSSEIVSQRLSEALTDYEETYCALNLRESTAKENMRLLRRHFGHLENKRLEDITSADITRVLDGMAKTPALLNAAFRSIRGFLNWCVRRGKLPHSPCEGMTLPVKPKSRDRLLSEAELGTVWHSATAYPFGTIVRLLILTGQRRGEIAGLRWDWISEHSITFPKHITKNGREHTIPIGNTTKQLIADIPRLKDQPLLFPARGKDTPYNGWSKGKKAFDADIAAYIQQERLNHTVEHWTLHDLRRTFATIHASIGTPIHITERLLNHATGTLTPIAAVYNRYSYFDEMKRAVEAYETHLLRLLAR